MRRSALAVLTATAMTGAALAQSPFSGLSVDPATALEMSADRMVVDREGGDITMTGSVVVAQGEMRLTGAEVLVFYVERGGEREITRIEATGDVTLVDAQDAAEAQRAVYDLDARTVVMTGDVLVTQETGVMAADRMTVDLDSGESVMEGRVRTVIDQ